MHEVAVIPRILGTLLYRSPSDPAIYAIFTQLTSLSDLFAQQDSDKIKQLCQNIQNQLPTADQLTYQFSVLFEGQGKMPVPPWGAVYLDKDNLLMSDSTIDYRQFLAANQLFFTSDINEPEDQFGLMLLALASLLEQEKFNAVKELLELHLLPWAMRYLTLLSENSVSDTYAKLGQISQLFLQALQQQYQLTPALVRLYF